MAGGGAEELRALSIRLKAMGNGAVLKRELTSGIRVATGPLKAAVADAARRQLPRAGGLNERVAGERVSVSVRTGARTAGVRLTTTAPDTGMTDQGFVRHPVFGRWLSIPSQEIPGAKGWWTETLTESAPLVTPAIMAVIVKVQAQII